MENPETEDIDNDNDSQDNFQEENNCSTINLQNKMIKTNCRR